MSMRFTNNIRTLCEVLREINDMHQGTNTHDNCIRIKLSECQMMAKKMSKKLYEYNKEYDKDWWDKNTAYDEALNKRMGKDYLVG